MNPTQSLCLNQLIDLAHPGERRKVDRASSDKQNRAGWSRKIAHPGVDFAFGDSEERGETTAWKTELHCLPNYSGKMSNIDWCYFSRVFGFVCAQFVDMHFSRFQKMLTCFLPTRFVKRFRFQELPTDESRHSPESYQILQQQFEVRDNGRTLRSRVNKREFKCGEFSCPTLNEIAQAALNLSSVQPGLGKPPQLGRNDVRVGTITFSHLATEDVMQLHGDPANRNALFQVASQFNTLEFNSEYGQPENGVGCYVHDRTQGPRCAMACAPGLVYRNYFLPFADGTIGQRGHQQIDNLNNLTGFLHKGTGKSFWRNQNGHGKHAPHITDEYCIYYCY